MRTLLRLSLFAVVIAAPLVARAQPGETPPEGSGAGSAVVAPDEAKIREFVDREVARILNERAAKDAADRAAKEQTDKETPPAAGAAGPSDLTGSSGFMDTRIAFTVTNENLLSKPGETIPSVPGWRFGVPNSLGVLFFDNYDTRYSGFETMSHAVMYRDFHKGHFDAEAGFVLRINENAEKDIQLADDGTYITLSNWKDPAHKDPTRISLTAFPISADRFRLGYSYRLSWGGNPEYQRTKAATPGIKLQYDAGNLYTFVGAKSSIILDRRTAEQKAALAVLAGAGFDPTEMVRLEVNGGYFDRGYNELTDVNDQKVVLYGASAQASIHKGMPVASSVDYKLYKNNNERISGLFAPVRYPGGLAWLVQSEFTILGQTLKDPSATGTTRRQLGRAFDLNARVMLDRIRLRLDVSYRDLAFILHSQPGLPTYSDFPTVYDVTPDLFASIGADKNWSDFFTFGVIAGVDKPASLTSPKGVPGGGTGATAPSTAVFRNNNIDTLISILPAGQTVVPEFAFKGFGKVDFGRIYSALVEVFYVQDGNVTRFKRTNPEAPYEPVFGNFNQLGINATVQARF